MPQSVKANYILNLIQYGNTDAFSIDNLSIRLPCDTGGRDRTG